MKSYQCYILSILLLLKDVVDSIRLDHVGVPAYAIEGKKAVLECPFDLEGSTLYSVKWYKNGREFFRYLPQNPHPVTVYVRDGVNVDKHKSNSKQVTLTNLVQSTTGRYRCEVSTEAPRFDTVSQFGDLLVVVLPTDSPVISGAKLRYSIGDIVDVNCTSSNSKPAADIRWLINGKSAKEETVHYPIQNSTYGNILHTSTVGLRFRAEKQHFEPDGDMKLKCTASIGDIYWQTNEKSAEGYKSKRASLSSSSSIYDSYIHNGENQYPAALDSPHGLSSGLHSTASLKTPFLPTFLVILVYMFDLHLRANIWLNQHLV